MNGTQGSQHLDRRSFLMLLGGGAFLSACSASGAAGPAYRSLITSKPIGVQLYTVRDLLQQDFEGTLAKVAGIGYTEFEFAGYYGRTPAQVRAQLDALDVIAPSSHVGLNLFRQDIDKVIADSQIIGHEYLTVPSANARDVAGWKALAAEFNRYGEKIARAGMRFAYHNHAHEFADLGGGQTAYAILLNETDPALVSFELDLYWTVRGGQDPLAMFAASPGRYRMFHVKDMADRANTQAMAPVGEGEIDFAAIFAAIPQAGTEHFFVEHDNAAQSEGGALESITTSYRTLTTLL